MGLVGSFLRQQLPPSPEFSVDQIPDLSGKVTIVTGGNTGVGFETAKALLNKNAKVYIAGRNHTRVEAAIQELQKQTGKTAHPLQLDLGNLKSIKSGAEYFLKQENRLDILFNNAGVMAPDLNDLTSDGYDLQFGTNVLGHFYLTSLLLPLLVSSSKSSPDGHVRVVNTSSSAAYGPQGVLKFDTFKDGPARKKLGTHMLYGQSKFGNVVFAAELARRYGAEGVISSSLNPGNLRSELQRHLSPFVRWTLRLACYPVAYGALTQLWAGTSAEGLKQNGKFLVPWARVAPEVASLPHSPQLGKELWAWMEEQVVNVV